jgi:hypothetical protein
VKVTSPAVLDWAARPSLENSDARPASIGIATHMPRCVQLPDLDRLMFELLISEVGKANQGQTSIKKIQKAVWESRTEVRSMVQRSGGVTCVIN